MTTDNSGGPSNDDIVEKLDNIDKWLNEIVHVQDDRKPKSSASDKKKRSPLLKSNFFKKSKPNKKPMNSEKKQSHTRSQKPRKNPGKKRAKRPAFSRGKLKIIPVGGFEEVGKNMMIFEYENDIIIVDMGFQFPTEDMLGVDYVLPDITYLLQKKKNIRGIFLTHGHLDHIGAIPYLLPKLGLPPVYGAPLTIAFVEKQLVEFKLNKKAKLIKFDPKEKFRAGVFNLSFFRVNHSIPDAVGIVIDTPVGRIVHTGDFKFDFTPADQKPADYQEIASVGKKGVMALISDSTNALRPGHTTSEKKIAENLDKIISNTKGRLIITSFSSLIGRIQQIMDSAIKNNRRIFLSGRSMETNIRIAQNLGYIKVPRGVIGDIRKLSKHPDERTIILTTGSQGEDIAALARMASENHSKVKIKPGDTVVFSSSPIIGNEPAVVKVLNGLCRLGAKVITNKEINIHTSGHAKQEDLKLMMKLIKPKYLIPAHGDFYMRLGHQELAEECGIPKKNVFLLDNGQVVEGDKKGVFKKTKEAIPAGYVMVEGRERSEVGSHVLLDRQLMAKNGAVTIVFQADKSSYKLKGKPYVESRGFVYLDMSKKVISEIAETGEKCFKHFVNTHANQVVKKELIEYIQHNVDRLLVRMVDKRPSIIPVIVLS